MKRNPKISITKLWLSIALAGAVCVLAVCAFFPQQAAQAQSEDFNWSAPIRLGSFTIHPSNPQPAIIADPGGWVHVFWVNKYDVEGASTIKYTRWDLQTWSEPVDILVSPDRGAVAARPRPVVDPQGQIHLIWESLDGALFHSMAPAHQANSAQAWSAPQNVSPIPATGHNITIDAAGRIHMIFLDRATQSPYYQYQDETTGSWSDPKLIRQFSSAELRGETCSSTIVVDGRARIHTAWRRAVNVSDYYARSSNEGLTWDVQQELGAPADSEVIYHNSPTLAAIGDDEIHLVWLAIFETREDGSMVAHSRYHQWSLDGGQTWTRFNLIFPDIAGMNGPNSLVVDSAGQLHQLTVGGLGAGAIHWVEYSKWNGRTWDAVKVIPGSRRDNWSESGPSGSEMTLSLGNQLHVVWETRDGDIWYSTRSVNAPAIAAQELPQVTPAPKVTASPSAQAPVDTPAAKQTPLFANPGGGMAISGTQNILLSLLPVVLFLAIVFGFRRMKGGR